MTTCIDLIGRALRKINVLPSGEEVPADQAKDSLDTLQGLYDELIGSGCFGRLNDITVTDTAYTAKEQDRIRCNNAAGVAITLPDTIQDVIPVMSAIGFWPAILPWGGVSDYGFTAPSTPRAPLDGSIVIITDQLSDFNAVFVYESSYANWTFVSGNLTSGPSGVILVVPPNALTLTSEAPFSKRYSEGLSSLLAERMADQFGAQVSQVLARTAATFRYNLTHRYESAARPTVVPYL